MVSDFLELTLFVLARNYTDFFDKYNKTVIETLEADGYVRVSSFSSITLLFFAIFLDLTLLPHPSLQIINTPKPTVYEGCAEYSNTDLWSCDVHDIDRPAPSA